MDKWDSKAIRTKKIYRCYIGDGHHKPIKPMTITAWEKIEAEKEYRRMNDVHPLTPVMILEEKTNDDFLQ